MPATYEAISTTTLGSAASSITFSSIPGTYTDLRLVLVMPTPASSFYPKIQYNSDTGSNYSLTCLSGTGTGAGSLRETNGTSIYASYFGASATQPTLIEIDIFSYTGSTNKTCLISSANDRNGSGYIEKTVGLWRNTNAITSVSFIGGTYPVDTVATLYGILKA